MKLDSAICGLFLGLALLGLSGSTHAGPAGTWRILPPAIGSDETVFDEAGGRIFRADFDHLWIRETSPSAPWRRIELPPTGLTSRFGPCLVHDPARDRLLLFGGNASGTTYADVWSLPLDVASPAWAPLATSGAPPSPRSFAAGIVDVARDRLIVFGGSQAASDLWALTLGDSPTWSQLAPSGAGPSPRTQSIAALDAKRDRLIVHGGTNLNDTWSFDLAGVAGWHVLASSAQTLPSPRENAMGCVDPVRDRFVLFGGLNGVSLGDVWFLSLDSGHWSNGPTGPPARAGGGFGYDALADRLLLTGGTCSPSDNPTVPDPIYPLGDLWEFRINASTGAWNELESSPVYRSYGDLWDSRRHHMILIMPQAVTNPSPGNGSTIIPQAPGYWALAPDSGWTFHRVPFNGGATNAVWTYDALTDRYLGFQPPTLLWAIDPKTDYLSVESIEPPSELDQPTPSSSAFDLSLRRVIHVGGRRDPVTHAVSTGAWTMDLDPPHTWQAIDAAGPAPAAAGVPLLEDPPRNRWILFETAALALEPTPHWEPLELTLPWPYFHGGSRYTYDPRRDRYVGYGAFGLVNGSAASFLRDWSPGEPGWTELTPSGPESLPRVHQAQVYDEAGDRMLVYGGASNHMNPTEPRELKWSDPPQPSLSCGGDIIWTPGQTSAASYTITNASASSGQLSYRLEDQRHWEGLATEGTVSLPGAGVVTLDFEFVAPDTAAAGINLLTFRVVESGVPIAGKICVRRAYDLTTPTRLGLVESDVTADRIRLVWWTSEGADRAGFVERIDAEGGVHYAGAVASDAGGRIVLEDRSAPRGQRVTYRLHLAGPRGTEVAPDVVIDVPGGALALALRSAVRPDRRGVVIELTLPSGGDARVALFDVQGRQVARMLLDAPSPGRQEVEVPGTSRLVAGIYFARVSQAGQVASGRILRLPPP